MGGWIKDALTGADNETVAIGRLIGMIIAIVLLIGLPLVVTFNLIWGSVGMVVWAALLAALQVYIPIITAAIGGLIRWTNNTEPKPKDDTINN